MNKLVKLKHKKNIWGLVTLFDEMDTPDLSALNILMHKKLGDRWENVEWDIFKNLKSKYLTRKGVVDKLNKLLDEAVADTAKTLKQTRFIDDNLKEKGE